MNTKIFAASLSLLVLAGCAENGYLSKSAIAPVNVKPSEYLADVQKGQTSSFVDEYVRPGITALEEGDLTVASKAFNRALKFDPTNSGIHFLNALTYDLLGARGDTRQTEYAEVGYKLALQFDPSNAWAAYQLGVIYFNQQFYRRAQEQFAYSVQYLPKNTEILGGLAAASYYARDLETAASAANKLIAVQPEKSGTLKAAAMINGAMGNFKKAFGFADLYAKSGEGKNFRTRRLNERLRDWHQLYRKDLLLLAQDVDTSDILGDDDASEGLEPETDDDSGDEESSSDADPKAIPRMALVDVVIIRSEERSATNKGFNLLNGLSLTFKSTLITYSDNKTSTRQSTSKVDSNQKNSSFEMAIPMITYSLNMFNDNNDQNEVIARPTLTALDGKKSEFFSGAVWHVELTAGSGGDSDVSEIPIGIKLSVTPQFIDDDNVILNITAARAFVENRSSAVGFNNFAQTTKTSVNANVVMEFGKTLVLSGLSEKETEGVKNGVPLLQNIPIVQYLFSNETTLDINKSVLILLTPRKPQYTYANGSPKINTKNDESEVAQPSLDRLKNNNEWSFTPAPNLTAVMHHLKDARFFREFRTGDVTLEKWDDIDTLRYKINRMIEFIYY